MFAAVNVLELNRENEAFSFLKLHEERRKITTVFKH